MIIQRSLILLAIWILSSAIAQIVMKKGMSIPHHSYLITSCADLLQLILAYRYLILGCVIYAISMIVYFIVLSRYDIHIAISIGGGLVIVLISLFAVLLLGEKISSLTWLGIACVVIGVCIIGVSKQ
ncbi:MAG: EamA family transporter [Methanomicrobiales archaeon]|jgi:drug/metabolite transporter (DMT)-like permease|nr:EamA family transporter [Methanomicrobiales archaeon]